MSKLIKPLKKAVSLTLDPEVVDHMKKLAEEDGRPLSQYINIILKQWIAENKKSADNPFTSARS